MWGNKWSKKAVISQKWPRDAPYIWMHWKRLRVPATPTDNFFSEIVNGPLLRSIVLKCVQNLKFVALHVVPEIIGSTQKIGQSLVTPTLPFLKNFNGLLLVWTLWMYRPNLNTRSWDYSGYFKMLRSPWIRRSRSSKVVHFGTNRKRVCDFLLVLYCTVSEILQVFLWFWVTPPLFHPNFGSVPVASDHPCWISPSRSLKLFGREIIFEEFQPMRSRYLNVTDGQTDRQTNDILWHNRALDA